MILIVLILILLFYLLVRLAFNIGKTLFLYLDLTVIFFVSYFTFLNLVGKNISEAPASYLWSLFIAIFSVIIYVVIIMFINKKIPIIFFLLQLIISTITVYIFLTLILMAFNTSHYELNYYVVVFVMPLFKNEFANIIANLIVYCICVSIIFKGRNKAFQDLFDKDNEFDFGFSKKLKNNNHQDNDYDYNHFEYEKNSYENSRKQEFNEKEDEKYSNYSKSEEKRYNFDDENFIKKYEESCDILNLKDYLNPNRDEIKNNYRQLAKRYHPDINKDSIAKDLFKKINNANDFLTDENIQYYTYLTK